MRTTIFRLFAALCLGSFFGHAQAQLLSVDRLSGDIEVERGGKALRLSANDPLIEKDILRLGASSRLSIRFATLGLLELGPDSQLMIERLPYATFAPELSTTLRLKRGFLHVVWNPTAANWALRVKLGGLRASLAQGEYFFEAANPTLISNTACVARGAIEVSEESRGMLSLKPSRCYQFESNGPKIAEYSESDWAALRTEAALRAPRSVPPVVTREPIYEIENAPPPRLLMQADTVPLEETTTETLFGEKEPDLSSMLVKAKPKSELQPIVVTPSSKPAGGRWVLQLASSASPVEAEREVKKLQAAGYSPEIVTAEIKGKTWHRVRISGFSSAAEARKTADELKAKLGYQNSWIAKVR